MSHQKSSKHDPATTRSLKKEARLGRIAKLLLAGDAVDTKELARSFGVDERTARDDIIEIVELGKLRPSRLRGGICVASETYHQIALLRYRELKRDVAARAAEYFDSSGSIAASPGTTVAMTYAMLVERGGVPAIVTNSIALAAEPFSTAAANITLVGGHCDARINATTGTAATGGFRNHKCRDGLLGVSGITGEGVLYVAHDAEVPVLEAMLDSVKEKLVIVADLTKVGHPDPWIVGRIDRLSSERAVVLVTNDVNDWEDELDGEVIGKAREAIAQLRGLADENKFELELVSRGHRHRL